MDLLGNILRSTPSFPGRGRLLQRWLHQPRVRTDRSRTLPGGATVRCDLSIPYEAMVWLKAEEEADLQTLKTLLKRGHAFIDGGANIGLWTLVAASTVGRSGKVWAFEPNPATHSRLARSIVANGFSDSVQLFNLACGAATQQLPLACPAEHNVSQIVSHFDQSTVVTQVVTLDSILSDSPVHGMKLDVEGFELQALLGAREVIDRWKPWLCVEFNTLLAGVSKLGDWDVHQHLTRLGYQCRPFTQARSGQANGWLHRGWTCCGYTNLFYLHK